MYEGLVLAMILSLGALGCDSSESEPRACQPRSSAWIRHALIAEGETEEERMVTELLILGHTASSDDETETDCLLLAQLDYEGSTLLDAGEFVLDGGLPAEGEPYRGTWSTSYLYDFIREPDAAILARRGAQRSAYPLPAGQMPPSLPRLPQYEPHPVDREIEFYREGNRLSFTVEGNSKWFEELGPLAASLDPEDPEQLSHLARLSNLGLLVSQVRLIGLSSLTAFRGPGEWKNAGLLSGYLSPGVTTKLGASYITLDYQHFSDIPGLRLHGAQLVNASWTGDGQMGGSQLLELSMGDEGEPFASAQIEYGDVVVKSGFADSGAITVTVDGQERELDVEDAFVVDFRGLMPFDQVSD
jgi:hypothetical protein